MLCSIFEGAAAQSQWPLVNCLLKCEMFLCSGRSNSESNFSDKNKNQMKCLSALSRLLQDPSFCSCSPLVSFHRVLSRSGASAAISPPFRTRPSGRTPQNNITAVNYTRLLFPARACLYVIVHVLACVSVWACMCVSV